MQSDCNWIFRNLAANPARSPTPSGFQTEPLPVGRSGGVRSAGCRCVAPLCFPRSNGGTWIPAFAGMTVETAGMTVETMGVRVDQGVGSGSETDLEQPAHAGRQGSGGDRHKRAGARRCVARRRHRRRVGPLAVRHQLRGARTAMTRRPRHGDEGYVMARRLWGGARTVRPRRGLRDEGSVLTRRLLVRGCPTTGDRHDGASDSLPGGARCSRMVLHLPLPNVGSYRREWGKDNGVGSVGGIPHPPALSHVARGWRAARRPSPRPSPTGRGGRFPLSRE